MARTSQLAAVLWISTTGWLTGCGRIWFDPSRDTPGGALADAPLGGPGIDAATAIDAPGEATIDAPIDAAAAPTIAVAPMLAMDTICGGTPQPTRLTVTNSGTAGLTISNVTATGDPFTVLLFPLVIAPGTSSDISIEPPMAVVGTDLGGSVKRASLKIESNAGIAMVDLEATVIGANIILTPPSPPNFIGSSGACPAPKAFSVQNTGNQGILVVADVETPFVFESASSDNFLDPGESLSIDVRPVTSSQCAGSGNVGFTATSGTICRVDPVLNVFFNITGSSTCQCS